MKFEHYLENFYYDISSLGSITFYLALSGLFLLLGNFTIFNRLFVGLLIIYIISTLIKSVYFKDRPKKQPYHTFIGKIDASSFPSLHATRSFFLFFIFHNYFHNAFFSLALFALALLVCYTRIYFEKHDYMDVLGGLVLGILVGFVVIFF
jgi:undecaprenyl-diphosphatase